MVDATVAIMNQVGEKVLESSRTVESLGERSNQIRVFIATIEDIVWHLPMLIHKYHGIT